jgi:hypothetical protein
MSAVQEMLHIEPLQWFEYGSHVTGLPFFGYQPVDVTLFAFMVLPIQVWMKIIKEKKFGKTFDPSR